MNMIRFFITMLVGGILLQACRPEPFKEMTQKSGNLESLNGSWQLVKATQTDADAQRKGFPYQSIDLTNVLPYTQFRMAFNTANKTFTTTPGSAPKIIRLASGNWAADNNEAPKMLTLASGSDTSRVMLGAYPNSVNPRLKLKAERKDAAGKVLIIYDYEFVKQ